MQMKEIRKKSKKEKKSYITIFNFREIYGKIFTKKR